MKGKEEPVLILFDRDGYICDDEKLKELKHSGLVKNWSTTTEK